MKKVKLVDKIVERRPMFYLMNTPVDTRSHLHQFLWKFISFRVPKCEITGLAISVPSKSNS